MAASDAQELDVRQWSGRWADFLTQGPLGDWLQGATNTELTAQDLSQAVPLDFSPCQDSLSGLLPKSWLEPDALKLEIRDMSLPSERQIASSPLVTTPLQASSSDNQQGASPPTPGQQEYYNHVLPSLGLALSSGDMASYVDGAMQSMMPMPVAHAHYSPAGTDNENADEDSLEPSARQRNADQLVFAKSERSDTTGLSDVEDVQMQAYQHRRARRRQSNRDSARRTRQRRLDEMKQLQDRVNSLTRDKAAVIMQNCELRLNCQRMAAQVPQMNHDYERLMMENLKLLHELQILRAAISQEQTLSFAPSKQPPGMPLLHQGAGMAGMHAPLGNTMGHMGQAPLGQLHPSALTQLGPNQASVLPTRTPTPTGLPPALGGL